MKFSSLRDRSPKIRGHQVSLALSLFIFGLLRTFLCFTHPHKGYHAFQPINKMHMPPLDLIESWPTPNYVDPVMRGPANIVITVIFFPLVLLIVGVRIYTRLRISRSFGADDWLILSCLVRTSHLDCGIQLRDLVAYNWLRGYQSYHGTTLWME